MIEFYSHSSNYVNNTFENHTDNKFWGNEKGRSGFPCCICGPDHTFQHGEIYLLFPDTFGAEKSAEIIADKDVEKWYRYVFESIGK